MNRRLAAVVVSLSLALIGGAAMAAEADANDPVVTDETTASSTVATESTESTVSTEAVETTTEATTTVPEVAAPETADHPDNHGADVSEAAHTCPTGPEHGPCVREVAKDNAGHADEGDEATSDEADVEESDEGDEAKDESEGADESDDGEGAAVTPEKGSKGGKP